MEDPRFCWTSASFSDVGLVRPINEDACLDLPERGLWAVADGMGGHALGDVASTMVIDGLRNLAPGPSLAATVGLVRERLQLVNAQLRTLAASRNLAVVGSTVAVLLARDDDCSVLWAGDSRVYLVRQGVLLQLTRDHSQRALLQQAGIPGAAHLPAANAITRAVGADDILLLDEEHFSAVDGDVFLLCSDGLTNEVGDAEILRALVPGNCRHAVQALVAMALQYGGRDNVSAVVVAAEDQCSADRTVLNPAC